MAYEIKFTDSSKTAITVNDENIDSSTSLRFLGKNAVNFSTIIGENFLHLLENFASPTPPDTNITGNPVAGQLWYDTTTDARKLMVYDGSNWMPSGGLYKGVSQPSNGYVGDLWVNTATQQLHLFTGSTWVLVGPNYSIGQRTGPEPESIVDTDNTIQSVISNYVNGVRVAIISATTFTPKAQISGFPTINSGVTLSSLHNTFWGTAQKASALVIENTVVDASNFLRGDSASVTNYPLSVKNNTGISIGGDNHFSLSTNGSDSYIYNKMSGGNVSIQVTNTGVRSTVVTVDSRSRIGILTANPQYHLDINGQVRASGSVILESDVAIAGSTSIGALLVTGNSTVDNISTKNIVPSASNQFSIGTSVSKFSKIYATDFYGTFRGTVISDSLQGNITGSATSLANATTFKFGQNGDVTADQVSFNGAGGDVIFNNIKISDSFVENKPSISTVQNDDLILISRSSTLKKVTAQNFFSTIPTFPIGCIMPYAGPIAPAGWVLCDGSEVSQSKYVDLFNVVGHTYGALSALRGNSTFKLPDLRGRFPMGLDNMNNDFTIKSKDDINLDIPGVETSPANRVTENGSTELGGFGGSENKTLSKANIPDHRHDLKGDAGTQFFGVTHTLTGADADAASDVALANDIQNTSKYLPHSGDMIGATNPTTPMNVMNPWIGLNYIIYTGVLS